MPTISSAAFAALVSGVIAASVIDVRTRRIPNPLTAAMAACGIGLAAAGISGMSVAAALAGILIGGVLMLPGYALGATGAGDVKLMGAVGAIVGPALVVSAFLFTAVAGGVLALAVAIGRKRLGATISGTGQLIAQPTGAKQKIRAAGRSSRFAYGPAIAAGSVLAALIS